jgi:DNA-binding LytR/AlgR family response regulator
MPRAIIADDERLLREQLRLRLAEVWPELDIVAEARNGREAVDAVRELKPDLAFLDIRMPGMSGVEAAREIGPACHIVFITAYSEYAVEAFEQGAVDYVLKPAERARLEVTVERLRRRLPQPPADLTALLQKLAEKLEGTAAPTPAVATNTHVPHLQWIQASMGSQLRMIPVQDVLFFMSDEKYTRVQTAGFDPRTARRTRPGKVLADPSLDHRQCGSHRRHHARSARPATGATEESRREARDQPQLHASVQADVVRAADRCRKPVQPISYSVSCSMRHAAPRPSGWPPARSRRPAARRPRADERS